MTKMPIAAALLAGTPVVRLGDMLERADSEHEGKLGNGQAARLFHVTEAEISTVDDSTNTYLHTALTSCVPFNVQTASELYWRGKKTFYRLDKDFGRMRPPYNNVWMEWNIPDEFYDNDGKLKTLDEEVEPDQRPVAHYAAILKYIPIEDFIEADPAMPVRAGAAGGIALTVLAASSGPKGDTDVVMMNECTLAFAVTDDGHYVDDSLRAGRRHKEQADHVAALLQQEAMSNCFVVGMALNLINCKNVVTRPAGTIPQRRSGREKRQGVKPIRYHTIVLPGMTVERGYASSRERKSNATVMALHVARGHFKTYAPEAPLMGRHVGTYWWNPTVRGNAKRGQVVSDYRIDTDVRPAQ
jgi:hypothetical protein